MSASTIDDSIKRYKLLQEELQALAEKRQVTLQQANENGMVQQELDALEGSTANVYKMMGPVLLRVELEDAKQNVGKRLDLIKSTMYVCILMCMCVCREGRGGREGRGKEQWKWTGGREGEET
jgi:chaperonin cofactor prefoldin